MTESQFEITREGPNALRVAMSGTIDAQAMEVLLQRLTDEMKGMEHGDMLVIDQGTEMPTMGAIAVELRHWPQMLAMLHQVDRCALVTHNEMFKSIAAFESVLVPNYEIRSFTNEGSAREWLEMPLMKSTA